MRPESEFPFSDTTPETDGPTPEPTTLPNCQRLHLLHLWHRHKKKIKGSPNRITGADSSQLEQIYLVDLNYHLKLSTLIARNNRVSRQFGVAPFVLMQQISLCVNAFMQSFSYNCSIIHIALVEANIGSVWLQLKCGKKLNFYYITQKLKCRRIIR